MPTMLTTKVDEGCWLNVINSPISEVSRWPADMFLGHLSTKQSAIQFEYEGRAPQQPAHAPRTKKRLFKPEGAVWLLRKQKIEVHKQKRHTCVCCHRNDCLGAFKSRPCVDKLPVSTFESSLWVQAQ